jgi:transposase-like protein
MVVMTLVDRQGEARTFHIPNSKAGSLKPIIQLAVNDTAHIITDQYQAYRGLKKRFAWHSVINHSKSYVRGIIHINFAESYHSLLKRGIFGTFHHVSERHLSRYLREFEFRWNSRKITDGERAMNAVRGAEGKRLLYRAPMARLA